MVCHACRPASSQAQRACTEREAETPLRSAHSQLACSALSALEPASSYSLRGAVAASTEVALHTCWRVSYGGAGNAIYCKAGKGHVSAQSIPGDQRASVMPKSRGGSRARIEKHDLASWPKHAQFFQGQPISHLQVRMRVSLPSEAGFSKITCADASPNASAWTCSEGSLV